MASQDARPDARAREAHAVVEQGDEGGEEGRRAGGGGEGFADARGVFGAAREEVQGRVGGHGPLEGADEAGQGVALARGAAAHVHHFAGEGGRLGRVAPCRWPAVLGAHGLQEGRLAGFLAVAERAGAAASQGLDEAGVYGRGGTDPFVVGSWEGAGRVEPCPHYQRARGGEYGWVGHFG